MSESEVTQEQQDAATQEQQPATDPSLQSQPTTDTAPVQEQSSDGADIVSRMFERDYTIDLTDQQTAEIARECADLDKEKSDIEEEKKKVMAEYTEKIKKRDIAISAKLQSIREGESSTFGMIKEVRNYSDCTVKVFGGPQFDLLIEERTMQGDEFQKDLFLRTETGPKDIPADEPSTEEKALETPEEPLSPQEDLRQVMREETSSRTKHSSVDGPLTE